MTNSTTAFRATTGVYVLVSDQLAWSDALQAANAASGLNTAGTVNAGQLLTISQVAEQSSVAEWLLAQYSAGGDWGRAIDGGGIPYVWLGASDIAIEGQWKWANGEPFSYTNWGTGKLWSGSGQSSEPDDYEGQDALAIGLTAWPMGYADGNGLGSATQWNDVDASNRLPYVIEFSVDTVRVNVGASNYAFDVDGAAGQVAKTLGAVFGEASVSNKEYAGIGLNLLDSGLSYEALMGLALQAKLGSAPSHADLVDLLYTNVVGTAPSQADRDFYVGLLDAGIYTPASLGVLAAQTSLNASNIDLVGLSETGLAYLPV